MKPNTFQTEPVNRYMQWLKINVRSQHTAVWALHTSAGLFKPISKLWRFCHSFNCWRYLQKNIRPEMNHHWTYLSWAVMVFS